MHNDLVEKCPANPQDLVLHVQDENISLHILSVLSCSESSSRANPSESPDRRSARVSLR